MPGIQADMMVIAASRDEERAEQVSRHGEARHVGIKVPGCVQVSDPRMDMSFAISL